MSDKLRIAIVDTYYPAFLQSVEVHRPFYVSYAENLQWLLDQCFGTFDAYSRGLTACGWETLDIIANCKWLAELWRAENKRGIGNAAYMQAVEFNPNVIFCQDLHVFNQPMLWTLKEDYYLAGQLSCAWPGNSIVEQFDILFTSFPHYLPRITELGVKAVFLPLAFDPEVHHRLMANFYVTRSGPREINVSFVGGLTPQFGKRKEIVESMVQQIPTFRDFGYGGQTAPAWGLDMYRIYGASKIVLNIHHPAAEGFSNNLRMFEATGMGALLLTEASPNIEDYFEPGSECMTYTSPEDAVATIRHLLDNPRMCDAIASAGMRRTLTDHTYANRMPIVSKALQELVL